MDPQSHIRDGIPDISDSDQFFSRLCMSLSTSSPQQQEGQNPLVFGAEQNNELDLLHQNNSQKPLFQIELFTPEIAQNQNQQAIVPILSGNDNKLSELQKMDIEDQYQYRLKLRSAGDKAYRTNIWRYLWNQLEAIVRETHYWNQLKFSVEGVRTSITNQKNLKHQSQVHFNKKRFEELMKAIDQKVNNTLECFKIFCSLSKHLQDQQEDHKKFNYYCVGYLRLLKNWAKKH